MGSEDGVRLEVAYGWCPLTGFDVNGVQPVDSANTAIVWDLQFVQVKIAVLCDVTSGISVPTPEKRILVHLDQGDVPFLVR